jgi:sugar/nucleoside kinase (ribokinase family)
VETYTACEVPPDPGALSALLGACDIFSPNEAEAASIVGPGTPAQLVGALLAAGATTVALRLGAAGALVAHGPSGVAVQVGDMWGGPGCMAHPVCVC